MVRDPAASAVSAVSVRLPFGPLQPQFNTTVKSVVFSNGAIV